MTADTEMPSLQVVEKLRTIPVIESACSNSAHLYNKVKGSEEHVSMVLGWAESAVGLALGAVIPPLMNNFKEPIVQVDSKLCWGLDTLQEKVPIVKDQPAEIYDKAKTLVNSSLPIDPLWNKANQLLTSNYGSMALTGLDSTSDMANKCIEYYLPPEGDENNTNPHPSEECEDKLSHVVHTIGTLSNKVGRRLYRKLSLRHEDGQPESPQQQPENEQNEKESEAAQVQ